MTGRGAVGDSALSGHRRERELAEATDGRVVDLLVVGLGVTGRAWPSTPPPVAWTW